MSDETAKLIDEITILKEKLDKAEKENIESNKKIEESTKQIAELADQYAKLVEEIEAMKAEKLQNNSIQQITSKPGSSQQMKRKLEESNDNDQQENAKKAKISVPNWLIEVLAWIKRVEMADSKLSISNWTFKQLCWPKLHGNVKPYIVEYLEFLGELNKSTSIYQAKLEGYKGNMKINIPIASIPPPNYNTGFKEFNIYFLDARVMKFIVCIQPILNDISLRIDPLDIKICYSMEQFVKIRHLCGMLLKKALSLNDKRFSNFLRSNPNALGQIEKVQSISHVKIYDEEDVDLLIQWLNTSRPDQKPKSLVLHMEVEVETNKKFNFIDKVKEQFVGSNQSANFIIPFYWGEDYSNFIMKNKQTGDVLALYTNPDANQDPVYDNPLQFLVRRKKFKKHLRVDWEKQFANMEEKLPYIHIDIQGIGEF